MKTSRKVALVVGGYLACLLLAYGVTAAYVSLSSEADRSASSGMYAFGDLMMFVAVFGLSALVPTAAALYFLRANPSFWRGLSVTGLVIAATAVLAVILFYAGRGQPRESQLGMGAAFAVLRILITPLLGLVFLVCSRFAPDPSAKKRLFVAALLEFAVFTAWISPRFFLRY